MTQEIKIAGLSAHALCINSQTWAVRSSYNSTNDTTVINYDFGNEENLTPELPEGLFVSVGGNFKIIGQLTFYGMQPNTAFAKLFEDNYNSIREQLKPSLNGESYVILLSKEDFVNYVHSFSSGRITFTDLTGIEEIADERIEQTTKHGFTPEFEDENERFYSAGQLLQAANYAITLRCWPEGWDLKVATKIREKDKIGRLRVAGSLIAAEIDRLKRRIRDEGQVKPEPDIEEETSEIVIAEENKGEDYIAGVDPHRIERDPLDTLDAE
jgi:hypothetical protein